MKSTDTSDDHRQHQPAPGRMLRLPAVLERVGGSKAWWYRLIAQGDAPAPVRYSPRHVVWPEAAVNAWIEARVHTQQQAGGGVS